MKASVFQKKRIETIRQIARELREDRGRDAGYAMRAARRYADWWVGKKWRDLRPEGERGASDFQERSIPDEHCEAAEEGA